MNSAIIVAAGSGTRMGPGVDKIFLEVAGAPVIVHTWMAFEQSPCVDHVIMVTRPGMEDAFLELAKTWGLVKPFTLIPGGPSRQDSVWNGCQAIPIATEMLLIHDGARPCVNQELIRATLDAARETGAAVAARPMVDTVKESDDGEFIHRHLNRSKLFTVQTPQTFRADVILKALARARELGTSLTDETAACELTGQAVRLVFRAEPNPKVTTPDDLAAISVLLGRKVPESAP